MGVPILVESAAREGEVKGHGDWGRRVELVAAVPEIGGEDGSATVGETPCQLLLYLSIFYFYWADIWALWQSGALFSIF
jgi:hypothetical protein